MTEQDKDEIGLAAMFATARSVRPVPGDDLMARILADAGAVQRAVVPVAVLPSQPGWKSLFAMVGGWPAMGGMALATMAGLWIGISPPAGLSTLASGLLGETVSVGVYADSDPFGLLEG